MPAETRATDEVAAKLKKLPASPGCYIYRDEKNQVLYVGKAVSLKSRVRSYFQGSTRHGMRIERMVRKIRDLEWIVVDSEIEALVLECNLIKRYRPPYNVRLRDDKSYPFITITHEKFPRVLFTRRLRKDGSKYYGPYTSAFAVRETLALLHKVFPLIPCGKSWSGQAEQKPCLYYHLDQCLAPCAGLSDPKRYAEVIKEVSQFLGGKGEKLIDSLKAQMANASEALDFERAAALRDKLMALDAVLQKQKVLSSDKVDQDVIAVVKDERGSAVQMLYVRGGKLIGTRQFFLDGSGETPPAEAVQEFVKQYYADAPEVPREILLPVEFAEKTIVEQWLRNKRGAAVTLGVPQGGDKLALVEMAATNAEQALAAFSQELSQKEAWSEAAAGELMEALDLPVPPLRIEGYDISNIQGTAPVGSMVVAENGEAAKSEYRRFKIRYHPESPDDFAMMHEVITRRLRAYLGQDEKFSRLPDLIMIDGGKGQLGAALAARDALGLTVPMVGLAKRMEILYVPVRSPSIEGAGGVGDTAETPTSQRPPSAHETAAPPLREGFGVGERQAAHEASSTPQPPPSAHETAAPPLWEGFGVGERQAAHEASSTPQSAPSKEGGYTFIEVELPLQSPGLLLLRRLRDEAHRFALTFHRKIRSKRMVGSAIEEIPGVGPRRRRLLLRTFGSVEGIRRATVEELASVPTMTRRLAEQVREYLAET